MDAPGIGNGCFAAPKPDFLAVSLPVSPLSLEEQQKAVVAHLRRATADAVRAAQPGAPWRSRAIRGTTQADRAERDGAYHQGTVVWAWLLGPFALAHHRVYGDRVAAMRFLEGLGAAMQRYGLGTLGEIFDGDAPFAPKGCIAQAWSVGEVLRAWVELASEPEPASGRANKASRKNACARLTAPLTIRTTRLGPCRIWVRESERNSRVCCSRLGGSASRPLARQSFPTEFAWRGPRYRSEIPLVAHLHQIPRCRNFATAPESFRVARRQQRPLREISLFGKWMHLDFLRVLVGEGPLARGWRLVGLANARKRFTLHG